jgi:hypothetical protein
MILKIGCDFENLVFNNKNSETGRRRRRRRSRRRRRRRFVVPRPGTTLLHLVKNCTIKLKTRAFSTAALYTLVSII